MPRKVLSASGGSLLSPPTLSGKPLVGPPVSGGMKALPAVTPEKRRRAAPLPPPAAIAPGLPPISVLPGAAPVQTAPKKKGTAPVSGGGLPILPPDPGNGGLRGPVGGGGSGSGGGGRGTR